MKYRILSTTEQQLNQANILVTLDYTDIIALGAAATGSIKIAPYGGGDAVQQPFTDVASPPTFPAGTILRLSAFKLNTPFVFSDSSLISAAIVVGDGGSSNRYLASTETNAAGTFVTYSIGTTTRFCLTSADSVIVAVTGTSSKNLNTATAGLMSFYLKSEDINQFPTA